MPTRTIDLLVKRYNTKKIQGVFMLPNLDVSSTTINMLLMLVIFGVAFYVLKSKKEDKEEK